MKTLLQTKNLPRLTVVLGVIGLVLKTFLYVFAADEKGLLTAHPLGIALAALTVAALGLIIAGVFRWDHESLAPVWPNSPEVPHLAAVLGFGAILLDGGFADSRLVLVRNLLAVASMASLVVLFVLDRKEKEHHFGLYTVLCLFFAVHLVSCYQGWSSNPQIMDYLFTLLAYVGLMLYFYHKAAALVGFRQEKRMLAIGLLAVFFCYASWEVRELSSLLHFCCGGWVLTDLCREFSGELPETLPQDPSGE